MPLGNVLDTELKHKQNYFARRIKHNSQTDEKREMLTIYNACGAEKKTVWRHTALLPSGNLNFRLFDSSGDAVSIAFKELVGHILCSYVTRDLYVVTSIVDYCISTEIFSIKTSPSKQRFPCYKVGFCAYVQFSLFLRRVETSQPVSLEDLDHVDVNLVASFIAVNLYTLNR